MKTKNSSEEPVNGTTLRNGRFILVAFDESGPCAWLSGKSVEVRR